MEENDAEASNSSRVHLAQESSEGRRKRCCCSSLQYRALFLIGFSVIFILIAEFFDVAGYLVFIGSVGIFFGFFMIMLDVSLYLQRRNDRRLGQLRFGARDDPEQGNIWSTSVNTTSNSRSLNADPPDYDTIMEQPEMFPFPSYLEDGVPSSVTSSSRDPIITATDEDSSHDDEDKLPSYQEVMEGSVASPSDPET